MGIISRLERCLKACDCATFKRDLFFCFRSSPDTLLIDYQFTFSLSQEDDRYYTAINFVATPEEVCWSANAPLSSQLSTCYE